jgi:hypothetical protein
LNTIKTKIPKILTKNLDMRLNALNENEKYDLIDFWCLTPLSAVFQLLKNMGTH